MGQVIMTAKAASPLIFHLEITVRLLNLTSREINYSKSVQFGDFQWSSRLVPNLEKECPCL